MIFKVFFAIGKNIVPHQLALSDRTASLRDGLRIGRGDYIWFRRFAWTTASLWVGRGGLRGGFGCLFPSGGGVDGKAGRGGGWRGRQS